MLLSLESTRVLSLLYYLLISVYNVLQLLLKLVLGEKLLRVKKAALCAAAHLNMKSQVS